MILAETFYLFDVGVANDLRQAVRGGVLGTRAPLDPEENRGAPVATLSRAVMGRRVMLIRHRGHKGHVTLLTLSLLNPVRSSQVLLAATS
jgi:hypothetical protein